MFRMETTNFDFGEVFFEVLESNEERTIFWVSDVANSFSHFLAPTKVIKGPGSFPSASTPRVSEIEKSDFLLSYGVNDIRHNEQKSVSMIGINPKLFLLLFRHVIELVCTHRSNIPFLQIVLNLS